MNNNNTTLGQTRLELTQVVATCSHQKLCYKQCPVNRVDSFTFLNGTRRIKTLGEEGSRRKNNILKTESTLLCHFTQGVNFISVVLFSKLGQQLFSVQIMLVVRSIRSVGKKLNKIYFLKFQTIKKTFQVRDFSLCITPKTEFDDKT